MSALPLLPLHESPPAAHLPPPLVPHPALVPPPRLLPLHPPQFRALPLELVAGEDDFVVSVQHGAARVRFRCGPPRDANGARVQFVDHVYCHRA